MRWRLHFKPKEKAKEHQTGAGAKFYDDRT